MRPTLARSYGSFPGGRHHDWHQLRSVFAQFLLFCCVAMILCHTFFEMFAHQTQTETELERLYDPDSKSCSCRTLYYSPLIFLTNEGGPTFAYLCRFQRRGRREWNGTEPLHEHVEHVIVSVVDNAPKKRRHLCECVLIMCVYSTYICKYHHQLIYYIYIVNHPICSNTCSNIVCGV